MTAAFEATSALRGAVAGDTAAVERLVEIVYPQLRRLAQRCLRDEPKGQTIQATELVHEVFLKLVDQREVDWQGRTHFFAVGAQAMRRILVDRARRRGRVKHGGGRRPVSLEEPLTVCPERDDDILAVDEALQRLAALDPQQAKIVELRFFGGMSVEEVAAALGLSKRTVEREWTAVRAWLRRELAAEGDA